MALTHARLSSRNVDVALQLALQAHSSHPQSCARLLFFDFPVDDGTCPVRYKPEDAVAAGLQFLLEGLGSFGVCPHGLHPLARARPWIDAAWPMDRDGLAYG